MFGSTIELLLDDLNEAQREAVTAADGPTVVFAGPGSGKTTVLTRRVLYLLEKGTLPEQLMVVTFTRAAAKEMKERLAQIMPDKVNKMMIGTFHSLFLLMLREDFGRIPSFLSAVEQKEWIREWLAGKELPADDESISTYLNQIGLCKGNLIFPQNLNVQKKSNILFRDLYQAYEEKKKQFHYWDYDDILVATYRQLQNPHILAKWQERFKYILVDEFQDINRVQYDIIIQLSEKHRCLFVVGDDDQAIYGFRGSDPTYMYKLKKEFPELKQVILSINYRSTDEIIHLSDQLIRKNKKRQKKLRQGLGTKGASPEWLEPEDEEAESNQILSYLSDGVETAILYRTSTQARSMVDALIRKGIPFSVSSGEGSFYKRWQVQDILAYFRLAYQPNDLDSLVRIMNKPKRYLFNERWIDSCWDLARRSDRTLLDVLPEIPGLEHYQIRLLKEMRKMIMRLKEMTALEGVHLIRQEIGYDRFLEKFAEETGNDRLLVFEPAEELLLAAKYWTDGQALLLHTEKVESYMKKPHPKPQVHLMTFHKSKGLEFDRVFLIGLHAMFLPHRRSLQVPEHRKQDAWEEERRLLYVAITRAKSELYLSISKMRQGKKLSPSPFLKELGFKMPDKNMAADEIAVTHERNIVTVHQISQSQLKSQPQLRFVHEEVIPGMRLRHSKLGIGTVVKVTPLAGTVPGRKIQLRFENEVKTLHYELARQLRLLFQE
ncbi:ATP-dependent helicase [Thermoflavimicrobium daqui]|nr:ATP-dependent helicase [Thermoflavimicrobium daqui]